METTTTPPSHTNAQWMNGTRDAVCLKSPVFFTKNMDNK